ncbi:MAG: hypothetical protein IPO22_16125 [Anaerolineales bacterium]|nr:hypothetical protein [Anaerolineales bacterium]
MDTEGFVNSMKRKVPITRPVRLKTPPPIPQRGERVLPEDNPLYIEHENWLLAVQQIEPQTRIYTYINGIDEGEIIAIGSTGYFREPRMRISVAVTHQLRQTFIMG